jgi:hypothetical protein
MQDNTLTSHREFLQVARLADPLQCRRADSPWKVPLPQLFTEEFDCDENGYNTRPDDRRACHSVGRQADIGECLTQDVRDEAGQTDGPEDHKSGL